jgi:bifunctional enzyme CysN/CysC
VAEVAHTLFDAGLISIVALVSPFASDREQAKSLFPEGDFIEVWVKTPAEVCAERDPKGLYKKAAAGELPNLTGVGQEYELPANASLVLDGTTDVDANVRSILSELL